MKRINNICLKLKTEKFLKEQLWQLLLVIAFISFCAWIFNKPIEAVLFCISHLMIRYKFDKQYHCNHSNYSVAILLCLFTTCTIIFFAVATCLPLSISLLSTIPVCYFVCLIGYLAQDRIDFRKIIEKLKCKTIWQMNETELAEYCYAKGIRDDMIEFVIMIIVYNMKYREIADKLNYSIDTLKDWSPKCKNKLGITNWKQDKNNTKTII